jgi:hypothetical protein
MGDVLIFRLWHHAWPALAALATMIAVFFWPSIPLGGVSDWLKFFYYYTPQNYLYTVLTVLAGLYVGIYVYNKKVCATCQRSNQKAGMASVVGGVLLGACPACIPALAVFLPLSATIYLSRISWIFMVVAIMILTFLIFRMQGFRRVES